MLIGLAAALLAILTSISLDGIYLMRIAGEHAHRMAVIDSLAGRLRQDALAVQANRWDGATLVLLAPATPSTQRLEYEFNPEQVTRLENGSPTHTWSAPRLGFAARVERGPRGDLLTIQCIERPPARAIALPHRTFSVSLLLPARKDDSRSTQSGVSP
jgi:hypothetical protein